MALHEVKQIDDIRYVSDYVKEMASEFIESNMEAAEIDIPENSKSVLAFQQNAIQTLKRSGFNKKIKVVKRKDKVYFLKK